MTTTPTSRTTPARPRRRARTTLGAALAALALAASLGACGDDGPGAAAEQPAATLPAPHADHGTPDELVIEATDFAFADLPAEVPAGTRLRLENTSGGELHELVAIRLPDAEQRPVADLVAGDLGAVLSNPPAVVLLAEPGGPQIPAVGDGTLAEPGRYAVVCMIPTGASPQAYLDAVAAAGGGKPDVEGLGGAPHAAHGMWAELIVS